MSQWSRRLSLVAVGTFVLAVTGHPSASAACPPLDAACQADEVLGAGEDLVNDTTGPVDTPVEGTVDPIIEDAFGRARGLLAVDPIVPIDPPDPIDDGGGGRGGTGPPPGSRMGGRDTGDGRVPDRPGFARPFEPIISAATGIAPPGHVDRTFGERFRDALGGVARSLAIVLALFALAVAFVTIQDRLDRNDPRLELAPVDSDVVRFA